MPELNAGRILLIEDDADLAEMLNAYFCVQGYSVSTTSAGEQVICLVEEINPDIILLDTCLSDIDGYELAKKLQAHRGTAHLPVILLSDHRNLEDKLAGLELGAVDYMTKPFDIQELRLRVRNTLQRRSQSSLLNTITSLPGATLFEQHLLDMEEKKEWSILVFELDDLDNFRDRNGFLAADNAQRAITDAIRGTLRKWGDQHDFAGQLGDGHFAIATSPQRARYLCNHVLGAIQPPLYTHEGYVKLQSNPLDEDRILIKARVLARNSEGQGDEYSAKTTIQEIMSNAIKNSNDLGGAI